MKKKIKIVTQIGKIIPVNILICIVMVYESKVYMHKHIFYWSIHVVYAVHIDIFMVFLYVISAHLMCHETYYTMVTCKQRFSSFNFFNKKRLSQNMSTIKKK